MTFRSAVAGLLPEIRNRHHQPIIAGGGTLYLEAILRGIFEGSAKDEDLRSAMKGRPIDDLFRELESVDPTAAEKIHRNDRLRITRALEVYRATGVPMSQWQSEAEPLHEEFHVVGLCRERSEHRTLIERRVRQMLNRGVIDEMFGQCPDVAPYGGGWPRCLAQRRAGLVGEALHGHHCL